MAKWTPSPKRIEGPLRSRLNSLAHAQAVQHEMRLRGDLIGKVQAAADGGATLAELHELVDNMEMNLSGQPLSAPV
jgi:hypothetical protein